MAIIDGTKAGDFITGTNDGDTIFGRGGDDTITGGRGNDFALMGAGNDRYVWNPGDGSDTVLGGRGFDTLEFTGANIAESFEILADGRNAQLTRNVGNVTMELGSIERIDLATLGGADTVHVGDLGKSPTTQVAIDLGDFNGLGGDGANDSIVADGRAGSDHIRVTADQAGVAVAGLHAAITIAHAEASDSLTVNGMGGNDTIDASGFAATAMRLVLDGGEGNDIVIGGHGNDVVFLGAGNDRFTWNPGDGSDLVEGQDGFDTVVFNGSAVAEQLALFANGGRFELTRDVGAVTLDMNGIERLELHAASGADTVTVNDLSGTGVAQVAIDLGTGTACAPAADADTDTVVVNGTQLADAIKIAMSGQQIQVTGLPGTVTIDHAGKNDVLVVNGLGGDDVIDASKLGAGKIALQLNGGEGADSITGSAGDDVINGNRGNDVLSGGGGNDLFLWNPGDGSDVIDGGSGTDTLHFNGANVAEVMSILANGTHVELTRNVASIAMDLANVERIEIKALGGTDQITIGDLGGTGVKEIALDLGGSSGDGDQAVDTIVANAGKADNHIDVTLANGLLTATGLGETLTIAHAEATDALTLNGLDGNDRIDASSLGAGVMALTLDGGAGNDVIFGSGGADHIFGGEGNDQVAGGQGDDVAQLGAGDDGFTWLLGDGSDTVDGGDGADTLTLMGGAGDDAFQVFANGSHVAVTTPDNAHLDVTGMEQIKIQAGAGKDGILIGDLSGTGIDNVTVDLGAGTKGESVNVTAGIGEVMVIETKAGHTVITNENTFQTITIDHADASDVLTITSPFGNVPGEVIQASGLAMSLHFAGGVGADTIFSGSGDDVIDGNQGNDIALMGAGNDTYNWDPGDGSDTVDGQAGFDTLHFNGSNVGEEIAILADGSHAEFTRNVAAIDMHLNSVERIEYQALGGADHIHVADMTGSGVKEVAIDLAGTFGGTTGDGAADTVTLEGRGGNDHVTVAGSDGVLTVTGLAATVTVAHADAGDTVSINGNGGNDTIDASGVQGGVVGTLSIDGGAGDDTITGGHGSDLIFGGDGHDILKGGDGADTIDGGQGDDVITGGLGDDVLGGGDGADTFNYTGMLDGHDLIEGFATGQDHLNLTQLFDSLGVADGDRGARVSVTDRGDGSFDVAVDADGNAANGFEHAVAVVYSSGPLTVGQDIVVHG